MGKKEKKESTINRQRIDMSCLVMETPLARHCERLQVSETQFPSQHKTPPWTVPRQTMYQSIHLLSHQPITATYIPHTLSWPVPMHTAPMDMCLTQGSLTV